MNAQKIQFFSELKIQDGKATSQVQILKTGRWNHPQYGDFSISTEDLDMFVRNFNEKVRGTDLCVDVNHDWNHEAVGWFRSVSRQGDALFAEIEWNPKGLELVQSKTYRYFSPELFFSYRDEETGKDYRCVLIGGGITNRPFFKGMEALKASEQAASATGGTLYFKEPSTMPKFKELAEGMGKAAKIESVGLEQLRAAFSELSDADKATEKPALDALEKRFNDEQAAAEAAAKAEAEQKAQADAAAKAKADAEAAAAAQAESLKASESVVFKETGMNLAQIKEMQRQFSEMEKKQRFAETEKKVDTYVFSDSNKAGCILPKSKAQISTFVAKLPEALAKEFFEVLDAKVFRTFAAGEIGTSGSSAVPANTELGQFSIPDETPAKFSRSSYVLDIVSKRFMELDKSLDVGKAQLKAQAYIMAHGIK